MCCTISVPLSYSSSHWRLRPKCWRKWFCYEKSHDKRPMQGIGETVKNMVFQKVLKKKHTDLVTMHTSFDFYYGAVLQFVQVMCILQKKKFLRSQTNVSKNWDEFHKRLCIHRIKRCEVRGVYYIKYYKLAENKTPLYTQW